MGKVAFPTSCVLPAFTPERSDSKASEERGTGLLTHLNGVDSLDNERLNRSRKERVENTIVIKWIG